VADQPSTTRTVPPADAQGATRHPPPDDSPLPPANPWDTDRRSVELKAVDADCLVLEPRKWSAALHMPLVVAGVLGPVAGLVILLAGGGGNAGPVGVAILVIGLLLLSALLLVGVLAPRGFRRWVRFDRRTGLLTISRRPLGFRRSLQVVASRPLTDIAAVQLLHAGWKSENVEVGEPGTPGSVVHRGYHSYQLNLVLNDPAEPRLNLCSHADRTWMRDAGQRLAEFLGVPLVDQIPPGH
jgi:hypothetical protein